MRIYDRKTNVIRIIIFGMLVAAGFMCLRLDAQAATANAHFGSEYYVRTDGATFNIGLYLESEEAFGDYSVTMSYDPSIMEYVSGASAGGDGSVTISGTANGNAVKTLVAFRAVATGSGTLAIAEASAVNAETGEAFEIASMQSAPIEIREDEPAYLTGISVDGETLDEFEAERLEYELTVSYEKERIEVQGLGQDADVSDTTLMVGSNTITLTTLSEGGTETVYTLTVKRMEQIPEVTETAAAQETPEETIPASNDTEATETRTEETSGTSEPEKTDAADVADSEAAQEQGGFSRRQLVAIGGISVFLLVLVGMAALTWIEIARDRKESMPEEEPETGAGADLYDTIEFMDLDEPAYETQTAPIISVRDVCMTFRVATQNVSGLKEWIIEHLKGDISYRELKALDHISFDVYSGEVVGIIGTNGSGKSTLLRIVSGALRPTSGTVVADRSKVQLLTLGTGFDMELTARENVYLNGAIIGYSREFIDAHYADIVEFAELEDFMEEKVKNFSSGMVSRLGFAIATAGKTAEILILDEVLSVGDEFFRQKSLARVKEMIHGGSTVLMVSHSMGTIRDNCTRAIWIEKGKMRMNGGVKEVCAAYQKQGKI